jgi:hypothetical protein
MDKWVTIALVLLAVAIFAIAELIRLPDDAFGRRCRRRCGL